MWMGKDMNHKIKLVTLVTVMVLVVAFLIFIQQGSKELELKLPKGFHIEEYADVTTGSPLSIPGQQGGPRMMIERDGVIITSVLKQGRVVAIPDTNKDGKADIIIPIITGLNKPHGLAFYEDWLYIAEETRVIRAKYADMTIDKSTIEVIIDDLPDSGHFTRTIRIVDDTLYLSIGSSCNICIEDDDRRGAILSCSLEGNCSIYATGVRNAVGLAIHPYTKQIWVTENARDWLGEDFPPDEINILSQGKHYGWPFCFGNNIPDPDFNSEELCKDKEPSLIDIQAHSAPLGLAFAGTEFLKYKGDLFVAYHGSWNRKIKTGYKVVRINLDDPMKVEDFVTGWVDGDDVIGRPVDVLFANDAMFISDDYSGKIYRVTFG